MMNPIYQIGDEKNIRAFVAYGKAADGKLYEEADFKTQVDSAEAQNAFEKNMLLIDAGAAGIFKPVEFLSDTVYTAVYVAGDGSTAASVKMDAWACKSSSSD